MRTTALRLTLHAVNMKVNHLIAAAITAIAALIFFLPPPAGASAHSMRAAALLLLAIGLWATAALPEHITALLFLALCMVLAIAPANVVFSGFESGTVWLVLGLVPGIGAYGAYAYCVRELGAGPTSLSLYLAPPYVGLMAWLALGEAPQWYHLLGLLLVLPGLYLATRPARPAAKA